MPSNLVRNWFGERFNELHPLLQDLHINGDKLTGSVDISYGRGLAGVIGRRLAKKMSFPSQGRHQLTVSIRHDEQGLHWKRHFNQDKTISSLFTSVGTIDHGYWVETTGPLSMHLTVDIKNGGWFWRCLKIKFLGLRLPLWLIPRSTAYKVIEDGQYRFHVGFSLPLIGILVSYRGLLNPAPQTFGS